MEGLAVAKLTDHSEAEWHRERVLGGWLDDCELCDSMCDMVMCGEMSRDDFVKAWRAWHGEDRVLATHQLQGRLGDRILVRGVG